MQTIEILNVKMVNKGALKAFFDIQLGGLTINGCRVIQDGNKKPWVSPPQREWTDKNGKKSYIAVVVWNDSIKEKVGDVVFKNPLILSTLNTEGGLL